MIANLHQLFSSRAKLWFVDSTDFAYFLDLAYKDHFGEIWLYNNDLQVIRGERTFRELYKVGIADTFYENIDSVKILLKPDIAQTLFGPNQDEQLLSNLRQIAGMKKGIERLSTFYFGIANKCNIPGKIQNIKIESDTWIFYTHRGQLDADGGVVMFCHIGFPFSGPEHRIAIVWLLKDQAILQRRLKEVFEDCFKDYNNFQWINVLSTSPFSFNFQQGKSPETLRRERLREQQHHFHALSLGDVVDLAIIAALPEERAALEKLFGIPKTTPLRLDSYRYIVLSKDGRSLTVLLATINDQGGVASAVTTCDLIEKWRPQHIILFGVAGGEPVSKGGLSHLFIQFIPRFIQTCIKWIFQSTSYKQSPHSQELGDVVVGKVVLAYELAKVEEGGHKRQPRTYIAGDILYDAAMRAASRWPKNIGEPTPDGTYKPCNVHYDLVIASGSKLIADPSFFKELQDLDRKISAIEMEGDGVGYACDKYRSNMIVIKGIMDRSDKKSRGSRIRDKWKQYAAIAAAQFVKDLLDEL